MPQLYLVYFLGVLTNFVCCQSVVTFPNSKGMTFTAYYDNISQKIVFTVNLPAKSWFSIGYGWNMDQTDMAFWSANGASSSQKDLWSRGEDTPKTDTVNAYSTTFIKNPDNTVTFTSLRAPDPGLKNDYVIEIGKSTELCYAFSTRSSSLGEHGNNKGIFSMKLNFDGTSLIQMKQSKTWDIHGWVLWAAWTCISLLQIFTNRYMQHWYRSHQLMHTVLGLASLGLTSYGFWIAFVQRRKRIVWTYHPICGLILIVMAILLTLGGMCANLKRKCVNHDWNSKGYASSGKVHGVCAYFVIFFSQVTISMGICVYWSQVKQINRGVTLTIINIGAFCIPLLLGEIIHRIRLAKEEPFTKVQASMSAKEFDNYVKEGRKLVILDELVLDVASFISHHPGGQFVLKHNIGRDISKFFHGGYSLEGNLG